MLGMLLVAWLGFTGTYEASQWGVYVVVTKTVNGYEADWYNNAGVLLYHGRLAKDWRGDWIEEYPRALSPNQSPPYRWVKRDAAIVVERGNSKWTLKRLQH